MATPPRKPLAPTREERRRLLAEHFIPVVGDLIDEAGSFSDLSVEQLITAGGISRSTFYAYFDDKGGLLRAMAEEVVGELGEAGAAWWDMDPDAGQAELRTALRPAFDVYLRHRTILGAVVETAASDPRVREQHVRLIDSTVDGLTKHIKDRQRKGRAAPVNARRTAQWLVWMLERGLYQLVAPVTDAEAKRLLDAAAELIWRVLYEGYRP